MATKKSTTKKSSTKKSAPKKSTAKRPATKKSSATRPATDESTAKKAPSRKASATKSSESAEERPTRTRSSRPGSSRSTSSAPRAQAGKKRTGTQVAQAAASQLLELTGREAEGVVGMERTDDGWRIEVEVVEVRRIPDTTDVLALYEVTVDEDGDLEGYRRLRRYGRGVPGED